MEQLTEYEYESVFNAMKTAYSRMGPYSDEPISPGTRYMVFNSALKILSSHYRKSSTVQKLVRSAKRDVYSKVFSTSPGVSFMNDIFDVIDNISRVKPASAEEEMAELKDVIRSVNIINQDVKALADKSDAVSDRIDTILKYIDGEIDDLNKIEKKDAK